MLQMQVCIGEPGQDDTSFHILLSASGYCSRMLLASPTATIRSRSMTMAEPVGFDGSWWM